MVVPEFPRTATGKVDLRSMPEPGGSDWLGLPGSSRRPLADAAERAVADAFSRVLGIETAGPDDDFFDLGGTSRSALTLAYVLEELFDREVQVALIYDCETVENIAKALVVP